MRRSLRPGSCCVRVASGLLIILTLITATAIAQQEDETLPGFNPATTYQVSGIDNVNLYNGDPGLVIPLGPAYPLGPGYSWQLKAFNSNKLWYMPVLHCTYQGQPVASQRTYIYGESTLGIGWLLQLGFVDPNNSGLGGPTYFSPDGSRHQAFSGITQDGSRLRIQCTGQTSCTVEFPDGIIQTFNEQYTDFRPTAGSSPDLVTGTAGKLGLKSIANKFATLLTVDYLTTAPLGRVQQINLNPNTPQARSVVYTWGTESIGVSPNNVTWPVVTQISFPSAAGAAHALLVTFQFDQSDPTIPRLWIDESQGSPCTPAWTGPVAVPFLQSIKLADQAASSTYLQTYTFAYHPTGSNMDLRNGAVETVNLPTGGSINYAYDQGGAPLGGQTIPVDLESSGGSLPTGAAPEPENPLTPDPCKSMEEFTAHMTTRTAKTSASDTGIKTSYWRSSFYDECANSPAKYQMTRRVLAVAPTGNPSPNDRKVTKYLFHIVQSAVSPNLMAGAEIERRYYAGTNYGPITTPVRTTVTCHEADSPTGDERCGFLKADGTVQTYDISGNARPSASVTWYGANPTGGGDCVTGPVLCTADVNSNYSSTALRYGTATITSTLPSMVGWSSRAVTVGLTPQSTSWLLDLFNSKSVTDTGAPAPGAVSTSYSFDPTTGFLNSTTTTDSNGTLTSNYSLPDSNGAPTTLTLQGSGTGMSTNSFSDTISYQSGLVETSQRSGMAWKSFDVDRDTNTGVILTSRDPASTTQNPLVTSYSYDALGRLTTITPPSGDASTVITYDTSTQTTVARGTGSDGTWERYIYDGLGRLIREIRQMTAASWSVRTRGYDAAGHAYFVSEWKSCTSITSPSGNCLTAAPPGTTQSSFDTFDRPRTVTKADGTSTTVSRTDPPTPGAYTTINDSDSFERLTLVVDGNSVNTDTRRDALGRVISVVEPGSTDITTYKYNALDKLAEVAEGVQLRKFTHDVRGFLRSEQTPEKWNPPPVDAVVTTTYGPYDALGDLLAKSDGAGTSAVSYGYSYDSAGRLTQATANTQKFIVNCYDGATSCDGMTTGGGGTWALGRRTAAVGWNYIPTSGPFIMDEFNYENLSNGNGRLTQKVTTLGNGDLSLIPRNASHTAAQTWTYSPLGQVQNSTMPRGDSLSLQLLTLSRTYAYGLMTAATDTVSLAAVASNITYQPGSAVASWKNASLNTTSIAQDTTTLMPRPKSIGADVGTPNFTTGNYVYDAAGNILSIGNDIYHYDGRSRITSATIDGTGRAFQYDRYGNLTQNGATTFTLDARNNHILTPAASYDTRGNLTTYAGETLSYDALNRQYRNTGAADWTYIYNADGERTAKIANAFTVTRREMARYVAEANVLAKNWQLPDRCPQPPNPPFPFSDMTCSSDPDAQYVNLAYQQGITAGCTSTTFCPDQAVTRAQMSVFLLKGEHGGNYLPPACGSNGGTVYLDVPCPSAPFVDWINQLSAEGITGGCGGGNYCPNSSIGEWQMLVFLSKVPNGGGGFLWAGYHPMPRGATIMLRDETNRISCEFIGGTSGRNTATADAARQYFFIGNFMAASNVSDPLAGSQNGWKSFVPDHLGTPIADLYSTNPAVLHKYWPYGEEKTTSVYEQPLLYAGLERDYEANHYYDHARLEHFTLARFLSIDRVGGKVGFPQSWNRYSYASNNPVSQIDLDGNEDANANRVILYPVNVVFSNASPALRAAFESSLVSARDSFTRVGIGLAVHRYEGSIDTSSYTEYSGTVQTSAGEKSLAQFSQAASGQMVIVSGDLPEIGKTDATKTRIGVLITPPTVTDELTHGLGNAVSMPPGMGFVEGFLNNVVLDLNRELNDAVSKVSAPIVGNVQNPLENTMRDKALEQGGCYGDEVSCKQDVEIPQ